MGQTNPVRSKLFRLLEHYVLDAIGELSSEEADESGRIVRVLFRAEGDWRSCLHEQFGLTPQVQDQLRELWKNGRAVAAEQGATLAPHDFAKMVVDENFADVLEMVSAEMASALERE